MIGFTGDCILIQHVRGIVMGYCLPINTRVKFIALKISNINQMVDFYTKVIGLHPIKRSEDIAYLGLAQKKMFIILKRIAHGASVKHVANIHSFTLVLPNEESLKKSLVHINNLGIKIFHVQTNKYYDMFSLKDPEGNWVSLCYEKFDPSKEDLKNVNWLDTPVKEVSLHDYLNKFDQKNNELPEGTSFGWLSIMVSDLKAPVKFYNEQFGLDYMFNEDQTEAVLMSSSDHRPQFVLKQAAAGLKARTQQNLGLNYIDLKMYHPDEVETLAQHLKANGLKFTYSSLNKFIFVSDPDNISMTFSLL